MSQYYRSSLHFVGDGDVEVLVESAKCRYQVWIGEDEVQLSGPGVTESADFPTMEGKMDDEDFAIFIVMLFENGLWPEE